MAEGASSTTSSSSGLRSSSWSLFSLPADALPTSSSSSSLTDNSSWWQADADVVVASTSGVGVDVAVDDASDGLLPSPPSPPPSPSTRRLRVTLLSARVRIVVLVVRGGRFAGAVFELPASVRDGGGVRTPTLTHSAFVESTVVADTPSGMRQSKRDRTRLCRHRKNSAQATLLRDNELRYEQQVRATLTNWRPLMLKTTPTTTPTTARSRRIDDDDDDDDDDDAVNNTHVPLSATVRSVMVFVSASGDNALLLTSRASGSSRHGSAGGGARVAPLDRRAMDVRRVPFDVRTPTRADDVERDARRVLARLAAVEVDVTSDDTDE